MNKYSHLGPAILRIGMALVFLYFGTSQLMSAAKWIGFVPHFVTAMVGGNAVLLVHINGIFELIAGLCLLVGFQVRTVALLLGLHLIGIAGSIGWSPLGVRDYGLAIATLSIFVGGADLWCVDRKFINKNASVVVGSE